MFGSLGALCKPGARAAKRKALVFGVFGNLGQA